MSTPSSPDTKSSLSRRRFLQTGAAASLAATSPLPAFASTGGVGDREIKIALIGCGGRGTGAAVQALSTTGKVKLWAMADAFEDQLNRSYKSLTAGGRYSRSPGAETPKDKVDVPPERRFIGLDAYRKVMALPEIDVVLLTTPPGFRPAQFEAAVKAGKHVFMEKPVATDAHGVRRVLAAAKTAKARNLKVGVGLNRRHSPVYEAALQRIHEGAVGRINTLRIYNVRGGTGKFHERRPNETELEYQVRHWYYFTWLSGDFIVEQSVHDYDVALWMKGQLPVSAQGQGGRLVRKGDEWGNIYDHFFVEYDFPDGSKLITQHRHIPKCWGLIGEFADGSKGVASVVGKSRATIEPYDKSQPAWRAKESGNSYQIEHDRLFRAIREDLPHHEAEHGAHASFAAVLGRMAAYTGQKLSWDKVLAEGQRLTAPGETWDSAAPVKPVAQGGYHIPVPGDVG